MSGGEMQVRILVIQTAFLGDVVLTLPLVEALHTCFPGGHLTMLTTPTNAPLVEVQPGVDAVATYDKRGVQKGVRGMWAVARWVRAQGYDIVVSPHRSIRSAVLAAYSGSPQRIGFTQWGTRWAYTATVPRPLAAHEAERNVRLLQALQPAQALASPRLRLRIAPEARRQADQFYTAAGVTGKTMVVGIIPGSQWGTKRWPAERFAALVERVTARANTRCILFGAPAERAIAEAITARYRGPVLNLIGQTSLRALPAYMDRCSIVVSNDTGPMHIAAALGKPVVALYGPTTTALGFTPYGVPWEEMSVTLPCRPCNAHGPHRCPLAHWHCMLDLSVDQVVAGMERLVHRTQRAGETAL
jgi:heptosyltransferase-2